MRTISLLSEETMSTAQDLKYIEKSIVINASAQQVWEVLTDFENWDKWNSFIKKSEGKAEVGTKLKNTFDNDGKEMTFTPKVLKVDPNKELIWRGNLLIPGLFDGTHGFRIDEISSNQIRFVNYENFKGIFSGMILKKIYASTEKGFETMNKELKDQVEKS